MVEENQSNRGSRYRLWSCYLAFNIIVFLSVVSVEIPENHKIARRWSVAISIISLLITSITNYTHFNTTYRSIILNTKIELYIISTLIVLWMILVALVSSPTAGLAVEEDGAVYLGNMYYFTWAGFVTANVLLASFAEDWFGISLRYSLQSYRDNNYNSTAVSSPTNANHTDENDDNDATETETETENAYSKSPSMGFIYWFSLMISSIVVLGSSADIYNRSCQVEFDLKPQPFCSLTTFTIVSSAISTLTTLLVIVGKLTRFTIPFLVELALCILLFALYSFELYYTTRANGPGSPLGNLYYFSWISFMLCFGIGKCCYDDYVYALEVAGVEYEEERMRRMTTTIPTLEDHDLEIQGGERMNYREHQHQHHNQVEEGQRYTYSVEMTDRASEVKTGGDGDGINYGNSNSDNNETTISSPPPSSSSSSVPVKDNNHNATDDSDTFEYVGHNGDRERDVEI